jgi:hypothetical protein
MSRKGQQNIEQLALPFDGEIFVVHCFFGCGYVTQSIGPQEAHDLMEQHYAEKHAHQIDRIVARWKR